MMNNPLVVTRCGNTEFRWGERTYVMGICNLSPDSFSGDGLGDDIEAVVAQAKRFVADGADIINNHVPPTTVKYSFVTFKAEAFYPERHPEMPFAEYVAENPSTIDNVNIQNNVLNDMYWAIRFAASTKGSDHGEPQAQDLTVGSGGVYILGNPMTGNGVGVMIDANEPAPDATAIYLWERSG